MSRTGRLFDLIQCLRARRRPVTGEALALELGVSRRTIYRDIETLKALGAPIKGEAGIGFLLRPGFLLPPLMLTEDELDALALGAAWVGQRGDMLLAGAARIALTKIAAVVPERLDHVIEAPSSTTADFGGRAPDRVDVSALRRAARERAKMAIGYTDEHGAQSERIVWPLAIVYLDTCLVLAAWCERRGGFRHFRTDRIAVATTLDERYPGSRSQLWRAWRAADRFQPPPR